MLPSNVRFGWGEDGDMFSKLENVFERETSSMGFTELQFLITEIKDYALIFKKYILEFKAELEDEEKDVYFKYEDGVRRLLLILQKFGVQMFYPYQEGYCFSGHKQSP